MPAAEVAAAGVEAEEEEEEEEGGKRNRQRRAVRMRPRQGRLVGDSVSKECPHVEWSVPACQKRTLMLSGPCPRVKRGRSVTVCQKRAMMLRKRSVLMLRNECSHVEPRNCDLVPGACMMLPCVSLCRMLTRAQPPVV